MIFTHRNLLHISDSSQILVNYFKISKKMRWNKKSCPALITPLTVWIAIWPVQVTPTSESRHGDSAVFPANLFSNKHDTPRNTDLGCFITFSIVSVTSLIKKQESSRNLTLLMTYSTLFLFDTNYVIVPEP